MRDDRASLNPSARQAEPSPPTVDVTDAAARVKHFLQSAELFPFTGMEPDEIEAIEDVDEYQEADEQEAKARNALYATVDRTWMLSGRDNALTVRSIVESHGTKPGITTARVTETLNDIIDYDQRLRANARADNVIYAMQDAACFAADDIEVFRVKARADHVAGYLDLWKRQADVAARRRRRSKTPRLLLEVINQPIPPYLIKHLINRVPGGLGYLAGPSYVGKSYLALHLGFCVATGRSFFGLNVKPGRVIYVASEGADTLTTRLAAICRWHNVDPGTVNVECVDDTLMLFQISDVKEQVEAIRGSGDGTAALLIVDTLAASSTGAEEQSAKDTTILTNHAVQLGRAIGAFVLLVAHTGKDPTKGIRGSSAHFARADVVIMLEPHPKADGVVVARPDKRRRGRKGEFDLPFRLRTVQLGIDDEDEPIEDAVVAELTEDEKAELRAVAVAAASDDAVADELSVGQRRVFEAVADLGPNGEPVTLDAVIGFIAAMPGAPTPRKFNVRRDLTAAAAKGVLVETGPDRWRTVQ